MYYVSSDPKQDDSASLKEEKDDYFVSITLILHSYTQGNSIQTNAEIRYIQSNSIHTVVLQNICCGT